MALSMDALSTNYMSVMGSNASAAKADSIKKSAEGMQGATYEEIENTMKTFESYLLEQTLKEVKKSIKEIRGNDSDEDPFMTQTTDMYMDQMLGTISKHMVDSYGQRLTKDLTDQTARMNGIEIPDEAAKNKEAADAAKAPADKTASATEKALAQTPEAMAEKAAAQGAVPVTDETE